VFRLTRSMGFRAFPLVVFYNLRGDVLVDYAINPPISEAGHRIRLWAPRAQSEVTREDGRRYPEFKPIGATRRRVDEIHGSLTGAGGEAFQ
jgi:hypothetical protein